MTQREELFAVTIAVGIGIDAIDVIVQVKRIGEPRVHLPYFSLGAKAFKQYQRNVDAALSGGNNAGTELVEVSLIKTCQIEFETSIESCSRPGPLVRLKCKYYLSALIVSPRRLLPGPKSREVVILLRQKIKIGRKILRSAAQQ